MEESNYSIQLNGTETDIESIEIAKKSTEVCHDSNKEQLQIEGIHSVYVTFPTTLFNKKIEVCIQEPPQDLFENASPQPIHWPR